MSSSSTSLLAPSPLVKYDTHVSPFIWTQLKSCSIALVSSHLASNENSLTSSGILIALDSPNKERPVKTMTSSRV